MNEPEQVFSVWVWDTTTVSAWFPGRHMRQLRGLPNANLTIGAGRFTLEPGSIYRRLGQHMSRWTEQVDYAWPAVVIETLRPTGGPGVLFEMFGELSRFTARRGERSTVRAALAEAGFSFVDVTRWGWEAPHPVPRATLGGYVDHVPAVVVAPD
jgi:hypothetical protein